MNISRLKKFMHENNLDCNSLSALISEKARICLEPEEINKLLTINKAGILAAHAVALTIGMVYLEMDYEVWSA